VTLKYMDTNLGHAQVRLMAKNMGKVIMASKDFILQRINIFAGKKIDPYVDKQVHEMLKEKFDIMLPQRRSMNESLSSTTSDHEVIELILQYRTMR